MQASPFTVFGKSPGKMEICLPWDWKFLHCILRDGDTA